MVKISVRVYTGETFRLMDEDIMDNSTTVELTPGEVEKLKEILR